MRLDELRSSTNVEDRRGAFGGYGPHLAIGGGGAVCPVRGARSGRAGTVSRSGVAEDDARTRPDGSGTRSDVPSMFKYRPMGTER